jgi:hypothetical protein
MDIQVFDNGEKTQRLDKPETLPWELSRYLVVEKGMNPDWILNLKCVRQPRENSKSAFNFRVFNFEKMAKQGVKVSDYASLNNHMHLVLLSGWYETFKDSSLLVKFGKIEKRIAEI